MGRLTHITLSFPVVGHTKFSPDWCFQGGFFRGHSTGCQRLHKVHLCSARHYIGRGHLWFLFLTGPLTLLSTSERFLTSNSCTISGFLAVSLEWCTPKHVMDVISQQSPLVIIHDRVSVWNKMVSNVTILNVSNGRGCRRCGPMQASHKGALIPLKSGNHHNTQNMEAEQVLQRQYTQKSMPTIQCKI